ncbi:MAG: ABC transporter ATP-binding protein [Romboutsia sp.]
MTKPLVEFKNLKTSFYTNKGIVKSVNDVSFDIKKGETIGIVGESGCGKSITAMSLMRLIPSPPGKIEGGDILFEGNSLLSMSEKDLRNIRGNDISMIFQEPMTSLNPSLTIGKQISEGIILHQKLSRKEAKEKAIEMINLVEIPRAKEIYNTYPHELSGGMRQRVMIAIALSCNPKLLIADEPTTALDVTIQSQILNLMRNLKTNLNTSIMLITHDLGVVAQMCDRVVVMYAGKVIEIGDVIDIFKKPMHPYTKGLLKSNPSLAKDHTSLYSIPGQVPNPIEIHNGCYFSDRCDSSFEKCKISIPPLKKYKNNQKTACWLYEEDK